MNCCNPRGVLPNKEVGGLGSHIKFGGKIWGKVRPSAPNRRKNFGSSVTTRRKSWEKVPLLGSYLKFRGQNLGLQQEFQRQILGPSPPPPPPNMEVPHSILDTMCVYLSKKALFKTFVFCMQMNHRTFFNCHENYKDIRKKSDLSFSM